MHQGHVHEVYVKLTLAEHLIFVPWIYELMLCILKSTHVKPIRWQAFALESFGH